MKTTPKSRSEMKKAVDLIRLELKETPPLSRIFAYLHHCLDMVDLLIDDFTGAETGEENRVIVDNAQAHNPPASPPLSNDDPLPMMGEHVQCKYCHEGGIDEAP